MALDLHGRKPKQNRALQMNRARFLRILRKLCLYRPDLIENSSDSVTSGV